MNRRITLALHRSNSVAAVGRLPPALYRPTASTPLPGERVVIRSQMQISKVFRFPTHRFSLRTMFITTAIVAAYLSLGPATVKFGTAPVADAIEVDFGSRGTPGYVAPLLFEYWQMKATGKNNVQIDMYYYLWVPGAAVGLPFSRSHTDTFSGIRGADDFLTDCLLSQWPPRGDHDG